MPSGQPVEFSKKRKTSSPLLYVGDEHARSAMQMMVKPEIDQINAAFVMYGKESVAKALMRKATTL